MLILHLLSSLIFNCSFFCLNTYLDCQMFQNVMLNRLKVWNCIYFLNCKQICSFQVNMQHNLTWQQCNILLFEMFFFHNFVNMLYQYAECSTYCAECSTLGFDSIPKSAEERRRARRRMRSASGVWFVFTAALLLANIHRCYVKPLWNEKLLWNQVGWVATMHTSVFLFILHVRFVIQ